MNIFSKTEEKPKIKLLDGYAESPVAHGKFATSTEKENEYFMQWIHPLKLHRIAIRSPVGFRLTYGLAEDVWNNGVGIKIPDEPERTSIINDALTDYLESRNWFFEMEKFTGSLYEQGEVILHLIFDEPFDPNFKNYEMEVSPNVEIIGVEAYGYNYWNILEYDEWGEPSVYQIGIPNPKSRGTMNVRVHGSRVLYHRTKDLYERGKGYAPLAVNYDEIVILSNIVKATAEAAYRWGTGHPLILTKDITDDAEVAKLKAIIGTPTRRNWHILPSEFIEDFKLIGQAGQMLNLKALADIVIDQIVIATGYPRNILLGEGGGIVGGEVQERGFYGLLDKLHTDLEPFLRLYFLRDVNIRKLLNGIPRWDFDWGIREVLNKMDQVTYRQKEISNALALTTIMTINECRNLLGFEELLDERGGIILGIDYMPADEANTAKETTRSTDKSKVNYKELEKDTNIPIVKLRENKARIGDSIAMLRKSYSMDELSRMTGLHIKTIYKIIDWVSEDE